MGLTLDDVEIPPLHLWACNLPAWQCFEANATQWRMGMGGPVALDYGVCYQWCADQGITGADRARLMSDIRYLEAGALQGLREAQENAQTSAAA